LNKKSLLKILIIGGGRWGKVHLSELLKLQQNIKITIYSKFNATQIKKKYDVKEVIVFSKIRDILTKKYDLVTIATKNKYHEKFLELFSKKNNHILTEKPFLSGLNYFLNLKKILSKKNKGIFISSPWLYNKNLIEVKNLIKNESFDYIKFVWHEKRSEIKYGQKKILDLTIPYNVDLTTHILSITKIICPNFFKTIKKMKLIKSRITKHRDERHLSYKNKNLLLYSNRDSKISRRYIILRNERNHYQILLSNTFIEVKKKNKKVLKLKEKKNEIYLQYKKLINFKKNNNYNFYTSVIKFTELLNK